jgi:hypothetical protein
MTWVPFYDAIHGYLHDPGQNPRQHHVPCLGNQVETRPGTGTGTETETECQLVYAHCDLVPELLKIHVDVAGCW